MTDPQRLSVLSPDGDEAPMVLPNQDAGTLNFDPAWSTDGQRLLFISDREK
jgi:Tol biopolymer transport system component